MDDRRCTVGSKYMRVFSGGDEQSRISLDLRRIGDEGTITNFLFSEGLCRRLATGDKSRCTVTMLFSYFMFLLDLMGNESYMYSLL